MDIIRLDLPYPEVVIEHKDPSEAKKLMDDYAGKESETTAILTYIYQSYILKDSHPDISKTLESIGISEMFHHELLGTTIARLGNYPVIGGRNTFWNGSFVNYVTDVRKILKVDIAAEKQAIVNYERTIAVLTNDSIKRLIERIILDEELHIKILNEMLLKLD